MIHIGCPIPFNVDEFLASLGNLMMAAYSNKSIINELVENMVSTYHPEGRNPSGNKDGVYNKLVTGTDQ